MHRILVADDELFSQVVAKGMVEALGHMAFVSPHGRHAYESLHAANDFALLLTDMMMPGMDGRQLVTLIRSTPGLEEMPVIIMSAGMSADDLDDLLDLDRVWYIHKPLDFETLSALVSAGLAAGFRAAFRRRPLPPASA